MELSVYRSLLTDKKTWLIVSFGTYADNTYREILIRYYEGRFWYQSRFPELSIERPLGENLKSAINIIQGKFGPKPWYAR